MNNEWLEVLKKKKENKTLEVLDPARTGRVRISPVLEALKERPYTIDELVEKLEKSKQSVYNTVSKYEKKKKKLVAFNLNGKIVFFDKKRAEEEGLI